MSEICLGRCSAIRRPASESDFPAFTMHTIIASMKEDGTGSTDQRLESRLGRAAERVRRTIGDVIDAVPIHVRRPAEFQRVLKLDRSLSSRILRALELDDPLASLHQLPGPQGLRLLLKAASKTIDRHKSIAHAEEALTELERVVASEVGDWKALDAALSGWLPEARKRFEMTNRQAAFRAMSNIKGVMACVDLAVTLIHPGAESDWADRAGIYGVSRLRRLRAGAPMRLFGGSSIAPPPGSERLSLDGEPTHKTRMPPLLPDFCSSPTPEFDVKLEGNCFCYTLKGDRVGLSSVADVFFADVMRRRHPMYKGVSPRPAVAGSVSDFPVRAQIVDVLVHEEVWPGIDPKLRIYDTSGRGLADATDSSRDTDRLDTFESIQRMGTDLSGFRIKDVARYSEMIQFVCDRLGWESTRFRGYRCRVEFPIPGTQVMMVFQPPTGGPRD